MSETKGTVGDALGCQWAFLDGFGAHLRAEEVLMKVLNVAQSVLMLESLLQHCLESRCSEASSSLEYMAW